jgi:ubiquinone/menaquinone biosynthesis C-methylase UbiE
MADTAPDYDAYQSSFHEAFRPELHALLDALPPGQRVIDVPCGNGFYTRRLADRLGPGGRLTAVDANEKYLALTREAVADRPAVEVRKADAYDLPFDDGAFDLVWCAQSLISLDPTRASREMARVVTGDGVVAILEVDEFHRVLLPWPVELEAAFPPAVEAATKERYGDAAKTSPARTLRRVLKDVGLPSVRRVTYPFDRAAPFDRPTTAFLAHHFRYLRSFAYPHLPAAGKATFDRLTDPDAAESLYRMPDAELVCLNAVYLARPSGQT